MIGNKNLHDPPSKGDQNGGGAFPITERKKKSVGGGSKYLHDTGSRKRVQPRQSHRERGGHIPG